MFRNAVVGDNAGGGGAEVSSGEAPATTTTTIIDTANIPRPLTELTDVNYFFKKDKLGNKRETVSLKIPYLTIDGLIEALQDEKQQAFILATVNDQIYNAGRWQVGDENKPVNKQDELDMSKMTLKFLAEMEPTERRGGGIAKEVWEAFGADYAAVMQPLTGKTQENIDNAVALLLKKFQPVKSSKKVVQFLKDQLSLWFQNTQNAEEFQECYEFLDKKAETLLQADEAALLASL
jgi:hypothetical protein